METTKIQRTRVPLSGDMIYHIKRVWVKGNDQGLFKSTIGHGLFDLSLFGPNLWGNSSNPFTNQSLGQNML